MRSKYGNKKTIMDGISFDSKREAERYCELCLLERAGEISELERQVPFRLIPSFRCNNHQYRPTQYIADFTYKNKRGEYIVEDVKGVRTKEYIIKKKLLAWIHGLEIQEVQ